MGILYGDSTPFEHGEEFIALLRAAVELGVALMQAQDALWNAEQKTQALRAEVEGDRSVLGALSATVEQAIAPFASSPSPLVVKTAAAVREGAVKIILAEIGELERKVRQGETSAQTGSQAAREGVAKALSAFMQSHDLPQTAVGLRLKSSEEEGYVGEALVAAPFGLDAVFALSLPAESPWSRSRRVGELVEEYSLSLPREVGLLSKRTEMARTRMEKFLVDEVDCSATRVRLTLRKAVRTEPAFRIDVSWGDGSTRASFQVVAEGGAASPPQTLGGADLAATLRLRDEIVHSTQGLTSRRRAMSAARFDGKPMRDLPEPQVLAQRLIGALAPIVREIDRRSGASGELVLRRDLGQGHRDEIYVTKAELHEKVMTLSPPFRAVFEPFRLAEGPRSPRATGSVGGT